MCAQSHTRKGCKRFMIKTALVCGGGGFIGSHLVKKLKEKKLFYNIEKEKKRKENKRKEIKEKTEPQEKKNITIFS